MDRFNIAVLTWNTINANIQHTSQVINVLKFNVFTNMARKYINTTVLLVKYLCVCVRVCVCVCVCVTFERPVVAIMYLWNIASKMSSSLTMVHKLG